MLAPRARGVLSDRVLQAIRTDPARLQPMVEPDADDADRALTLWLLHELHYRGFDDVDDAVEWHPAPLALRWELERELEARLRERWERSDADAGDPQADVGDALFALVDGHDGAGTAKFVQTRAGVDQALQLLRMRSIYHLKESDPTSWVVPRLPVRAKAALVELQYDEYGAGDPNRLHHHLFARALEEAGLSSDYGRYLDEVPFEVLEQNNVGTMFGLHRRLRGAAMGHLAAFEATSAVPSRQLAQGYERLGLGDAVVAYYREHVAADSVHDQLAARVVCGTLVDDEPALRDDVMFGAWTCLDLEDRLARRVLAGWEVEAA